jgi:hypothetical protein
VAQLHGTVCVEFDQTLPRLDRRPLLVTRNRRMHMLARSAPGERIRLDRVEAFKGQLESVAAPPECDEPRIIDATRRCSQTNAQGSPR